MAVIFMFQKNKASHGRAKRSLDAAQKGSPLHGNALFHAAKAAHHTREKRSLTDLAQRFRLGNTNAEKQTVNKAMEKIKALKERASNRPEFNNLFNRNRNKLFTPFK